MKMDDADAPQAAGDGGSQPNVWLHYGDPVEEEFEDFIVGSREGLLELRDRIDEALLEGVAYFEHPDIQFDGVRVDDRPDPEPPRVHPCYECVWAWGCLLLVALILCLAVVGVWTLFFE